MQWSYGVDCDEKELFIWDLPLSLRTFRSKATRIIITIIIKFDLNTKSIQVEVWAIDKWYFWDTIEELQNFKYKLIWRLHSNMLFVYKMKKRWKDCVKHDMNIMKVNLENDVWREWKKKPYSADRRTHVKWDKGWE